MKESAVNFWLNVLSVVLGIAITFSIQGIIDHSRDRKEVRSALELIRSELQVNRDDIAEITEYLRQERRSASYLAAHSNDLNGCPIDSVLYHGGIVFAEASITTSHDALELLKMSSLFQKIGDNNLSMKIIRAYDACESIASTVNRHIETRNSRFQVAIDDIREYVRTETGYYTILWLATQAEPSSFTDPVDLDAAIRAIDVYLHRR